MISFVFHVVGLLLPGVLLGRKLRLPLPLLVGAMFLIFEASLVVGAGLLSWAALLGELRAYQIVTTLCAIAIAAAIWWIARLRGPAEEQKPAQTPNVNPEQRTSFSTALLYAAPILGLVVFGALILLLTLNAYPAVEDSLTIKLPKIIFAIQANSILPTDFTDDGRMYISPVYPALIQLFLIINGQTGHALLVFGFVNWLVCSVALYQICRYAGATKLSSLLVTSLALLAPTLVAQGSSEGDDLIATTPFVLGSMFLIPALQERDSAYAVLGGVGIGLSFAMKLLPLFYLPALVVLIAVIILSRGGLKWLSERVSTALWISAGFVFALLPNAIANWIAFGNPLYVSQAVSSARNWPFNAECAVRASIGHLKQLVLTDMVRLTAALFSITADPASQGEIFRSNVATYNDFFSRMLPYNPVPACTAYGTPFELTNPLLNENTLWFGALGPLLLASSIIAVIALRLPPVVRALGLAFLGWQVAFDFMTRYYGENGRYWSMAVLVGCPTIAVLVDILMRRRWGVRLVLFGLGLTGVVTALQAIFVLHTDNHRALPQALRTSRYSNIFTPEAADVMVKAKAVNVQLLYGINTYDYYMRLGPEAKLFNKVSVIDDMVNIVAVRPFGVIDNPYGDFRMPVRMRRPFAGGFRFVGAAPGQNLSFANNMELVGGTSADAGSSYLIFGGQQLKKDAQAISGLIYQIASPAIEAKVRYRIGWREADGALEMSSEWHRGAYADFKVPERAAMLVIEAAFDGDTEASSSEWPIKGFLTGVGPKMVRMFDEAAKQ